MILFSEGGIEPISSSVRADLCEALTATIGRAGAAAAASAAARD